MDDELKYAEKELRLFRTWLRATKSLYDNVTKDIKKHGLTIENFMVLELLYNRGPQYIQVISEKLEIPSGSITYVVNKLEKKGLAKRELNEGNKRYCRVLITQDGKDILNEIFPKHTEMIVKNLEVLNESDKDELTRLLKMVGLSAKDLS